MPRACRAALTGLLLLASLSVFGAAPAHAQRVPDVRSVRSTALPDQERLGTRFGSFVGYLSVGLRETYNDNVFADSDEPEADLITHARPRIRIESDWRRHGLAATVEADASRHLEHPEENVVDYGASLSGHLDIAANGRVGAELSASREHEDRASPDDPDGEERTPIDRYAAALTAEQRFHRLGLAFAGSYERLDFDDVATATSGGGINNDDRDRTVARVAGRVSYGISGVYEPFVQAAYDVISYDQERDDNGFDRDSTGYEISAGTRYHPNGFTVMEGRVGLRKQRLDDNRLDEVSGATAEVSLKSNLTPATTGEAFAQRMFQQSTLTSASAFFSTLGRARLDHAFSPRLMVGVEGSLARHTFTGIAREDTILGAGVDARYDPTAYLRLSLDYGFTQRSSTADADFTRNAVTLGAEMRY
jgi:hypothetical protein